MTIAEFTAWVLMNQQRKDGFVLHFNDPAAFRDHEMEASRREFMGRKETVMSDPVPEPALMPVAPLVDEPLVCRHCPGWTDGSDPRWSDEAVSPQGVWREIDGGSGWLHHCRVGVWMEAVNPFRAEGL